MKKTLIIDNYDSFTYNLYQYIGELKGNPVVKRNDEITIDEIKALKPSHIILSPGPGTPENPKDIGICKDVILELGKHTPLLGVCLGHQTIIHSFEGEIIPASKIMHGKTSTITHSKKGLFNDIPSPIEVMRYHSLVGKREALPQDLTITAETKDNKTIMAVQHKTYPIFGIQFHPESIGTPDGLKILENFLSIHV